MATSPIHALGEWQNFYMLTGGAAATLTGLLFIALSLSVEVTEGSGVIAIRTFFTPTFLHFVDVLVVAALCLIPTQTDLALGALLVLLAAGNLWFDIIMLRPQLRNYSPSDVDLPHRLWNLFLPVATCLVLLAAGIGIAAGRTQALTALALAIIAFLVIGIRNAWNTMTWVTARRIDRPPSSSHDDA